MKKIFNYILILLSFFLLLYVKKIIDHVTELKIYFYLIFIIFFWLISFKKMHDIVGFLKIFSINLFLYITISNFIYLFDFPISKVDNAVGSANYNGFSMSKNLVTFYLSFAGLLFLNLIYFKYYDKK